MESQRAALVPGRGLTGSSCLQQYPKGCIATGGEGPIVPGHDIRSSGAPKPSAPLACLSGGARPRHAEQQGFSRGCGSVSSWPPRFRRRGPWRPRSSVLGGTSWTAVRGQAGGVMPCRRRSRVARFPPSIVRVTRPSERHDDPGVAPRWRYHVMGACLRRLMSGARFGERCAPRTAWQFVGRSFSAPLKRSRWRVRPGGPCLAGPGKPSRSPPRQ